MNQFYFHKNQGYLALTTTFLLVMKHVAQPPSPNEHITTKEHSETTLVSEQVPHSNFLRPRDLIKQLDRFK